ncbi:MATE family efflux transporter [Dyella silvatica]|uniref:MATE family efflux transporter n=1 Tax=Dyella silvatica TaxID=2992128 RepID=UPI0022549C90|nr:MATE family efflux transporter [Dyella silvatica]
MKDLTQGSMIRQLLNLASAMIVNMIAGTLYTLVNFFWLGKLGPKAQAAVALAGSPIMIVLTLVPIITVGARVLISQAVGAKDQALANRIFNETFGAAVILMALAGCLAWIFRGTFGALLTPDGETSLLITQLLLWYIPSIAIQVPSAVMGAALGGTGNMRASMLAQLVSVMVNLIVSPLVIFGWLGFPKLGIVGAGAASFASTLAALAILGFYFIGKTDYLKFQPMRWFSKPLVLWRAFKIGLPVGIQSAVLACYMLLVLQLLRPFGPSEQAAMGIGQRLIQSAIMPIVALSSATSVVAGQNFGAKLGHRVRECFRASITIGFIATPLMFIVAQLFAQSICKAFSDDPQVVANTVTYLRIMSFNLFPLTVILSCFGTLTGLGNTRASLITVIVSSILMIVPAWALSFHPDFNPSWMWELMLASSIAEMIMGLTFIRAEFRKRLYVAQSPAALECPS